MKLNVILGKTDHLASSFAEILKNYISFFKNKGGAFKGIKQTYSAYDGTMDEPSKRNLLLIQTTVDEKIDYFKETVKDYISSLFSIEKTNASGLAKASLIVEGESWGEFTSLELLRLKSIIENNLLIDMIQNLPVRSDSMVWEPCTEEEYENRNVHQTSLQTHVNKTTIIENYILPDPNIVKDSKLNYTPQVGKKNTIIELGVQTVQSFSGETTQTKKAHILRRRTVLLNSVIVALKQANEVEIVNSELTSEKLFNYLFN